MQPIFNGILPGFLSFMRVLLKKMTSIFLGESDSGSSGVISGKVYSPNFTTTGPKAADLVAFARHELGPRYALDRPLCRNELARLVGLKPGPGNVIAKIEAGRANLRGPVEVVIRMLLDGHCSPRHAQSFRLLDTGRVVPATPVTSGL